MTIVNSNVGENLQDHAMAGGIIRSRRRRSSSGRRDPQIFKTLLAMYQTDHSGPFGGEFLPSTCVPLPETLCQKTKLSCLPNILSRVTSESPASIDKFQESVTLDLLTQPDVSSVHYMMGELQLNVEGNTKISDFADPKCQETISLSSPHSITPFHAAASTSPLHLLPIT